MGVGVGLGVGGCGMGGGDTAVNTNQVFSAIVALSNFWMTTWFTPTAHTHSHTQSKQKELLLSSDQREIQYMIENGTWERMGWFAGKPSRWAGYKSPRVICRISIHQVFISHFHCLSGAVLRNDSSHKTAHLALCLQPRAKTFPHKKLILCYISRQNLVEPSL